MIQKLPPETYQRIKAGEVIEDAASVVRELLDNALDANATQIVVEVEEAGLKKILIRDDGDGMNSADLQVCFLEHTTSKIQQFEDIASLQTNGFRGEALASICRIAHVNILSATKDQKTSEKIWIQQSEIEKRQLLAHRQGTIIEIEDLFYNLPVRRSFLNSKKREVSKIKREILQKALAYPNVTFQFISDKKTLLFCLPQSYKDRLLDLSHITPPLYSLQFEGTQLHLQGEVTGIDQVFDSSNELFFFLNGRPYQSKMLYGCMKRALSQLIPKHKYLGGCIYITTPPSNIDPNIHPTKKEIKLYNEQELARGLYLSLQSIFYRSSYYTFVDLPKTPQEAQSPPPPTEYAPPSVELLDFSSPSKENPDLTLPLDPNLSSDGSPNISHDKNSSGSQKSSRYRFIGVYQGTYWIVEKDQDIILIDFHAAHERIRYEELRAKAREQQTVIQPLLMPEVISLSPCAWESLENNQTVWQEMGFDFDLLGDCNVAIRGVPAILGDQALPSFIHFLREMTSNVPITLTDLQDRWLKFNACRKSYMANDQVPEREIHALLDKIFSHDFPLTCPHGRPFTLTMLHQSITGHFLR